MNIRKGDIVARKSYGKDIIFAVDKIIKRKDEDNIAILKGIIIRIKADAPVSDLEYVSKQEVEKSIQMMDDMIEKRAKQFGMIEHKFFPKFRKDADLQDSYREVIYTGKILHLDGDRRYSDKSAKYYREMGLTAVVRNIPEYKQASQVRKLLEFYQPDILVITGHDSMIKNGSDYNNIYNYRNSRHFVNTVREARKWGRNSEELVIFAGACQSYFEAIMMAGADFASSPSRILIDFIDPLIVAEKVATTERSRYISISQIAQELKGGKDSIGGTGVNGKKRIFIRKKKQILQN